MRSNVDLGPIVRQVSNVRVVSCDFVDRFLGCISDRPRTYTKQDEQDPGRADNDQRCIR